jgi:dephospho-CoA kinase
LDLQVYLQRTVRVMFILGITGGVATGKSTVSRMFGDLGAIVVSADKIAHDLLAPGTPLTKRVLEQFPDVSIQGSELQTIDRSQLGRLVFADSSQREILNSLTHPAIVASLESEVSRLRPLDAPAIAAIEIPLLYETELEYLVDAVLVVACLLDTQVKWLRARSGLGETEARQQIAAQLPLDDKVLRADYVIDADFDLAVTRRQVNELWDRLVKLKRQ